MLTVLGDRRGEVMNGQPQPARKEGIDNSACPNLYLRLLEGTSRQGLVEEGPGIFDRTWMMRVR